MSVVLHPPHVPEAAGPPPVSPPPQLLRGVRPGRGIVWGSAAALLAAAVALVIAAMGWVAPSGGAVSTVVVPWSPPSPSAAEVAAARTQACKLWGITASAMDDASNLVAHTPGDWNAPDMQEALANEARVIAVEGAYLRRALPDHTPAAIRSGIEDYLAASFDMENATTHRQGTSRNAAIDRANAAEDRVNAACR